MAMADVDMDMDAGQTAAARAGAGGGPRDNATPPSIFLLSPRGPSHWVWPCVHTFLLALRRPSQKSRSSLRSPAPAEGKASDVAVNAVRYTRGSLWDEPRAGAERAALWRPSLSRERSRPLVAVLRPPRSQWGATGRAPPRADRGGKRRGSRAALPSCRGRSPAARLSSFPGCSAFRFSPASAPFALSVDTRRTERGQRAWTRESLRAH